MGGLVTVRESRTHKGQQGSYGTEAEGLRLLGFWESSGFRVRVCFEMAHPNLFSVGFRPTLKPTAHFQKLLPFQCPGGSRESCVPESGRGSQQALVSGTFSSRSYSISGRKEGGDPHAGDAAEAPGLGFRGIPTIPRGLVLKRGVKSLSLGFRGGLGCRVVP